MKAADILRELRARDIVTRESEPANFGPVILLMQDAVLVRLVACWPNIQAPTDPDPNEECPAGIAASDRVRWYWARLEPDPIPEWIALAGLPDALHVRRAARTAIDNRIVLPDGTVSTWAGKFLASHVASVIGSK